MIESSRTFTFDRFLAPAGQAADLSVVSAEPAGRWAEAGAQDGAPQDQAGRADERGSPPVAELQPAAARVAMDDAVDAAAGTSEVAPASAAETGAAAASASEHETAPAVEEDASQDEPATAAEGREGDTPPTAEEAQETTPPQETQSPGANAVAQDPILEPSDGVSAAVDLDFTAVADASALSGALPTIDLQVNPAVTVDLPDAPVIGDIAAVVTPIASQIAAFEALTEPVLEIAPSRVVLSGDVRHETTVEEDVAQVLEAVAIAAPVDPAENGMAFASAVEAEDLSLSSYEPAEAPVIETALHLADDVDLGGLGL